MLEALLADKGVKIHHTNLIKWADANPEWARALLEKEAARPERILAALVAAKADATKLESDHFIGIKAQLVGRLYESVKQLPLTTIDEWRDALDCLDKIEQFVHSERGKVITAPQLVPSTSLMDRLNPKVTVPAFKKPNGNGAS